MPILRDLQCWVLSAAAITMLSACGGGTPGGNSSSAPASSSAATSSSSPAVASSSSESVSSASSSSAIAASEYCPADQPCRILPLGDSITDGIGYKDNQAFGGYRIELFRLINEAGFDATFVGNQANGPQQVAGVNFPRAHEGHSGWTIQQIDDIVPSPALDQAPHIILLHIGTNDMYQQPSGAGQRLGDLMDDITANAPEALLVVSNIIPSPIWSDAVSQYNSVVPDVVETRITQGDNVVYVDQNSGFPTSELTDQVHPDQQGYERMAAVWYEAIFEHLVAID